MNSIEGVGSGSVALEPKTVQKVSAEKVANMVSSIKNIQIELIAGRMAAHIIEHLGPQAKADIANDIYLKCSEEEKEEMKMHLLTANLNAKMSQEEKKPFLDEIKRAHLVLGLLTPIKKDLINVFSLPRHFVETGVTFILSDYHPQGFLEEIAQKVKANLSMFDVPMKWVITLKIDMEQTTNSQLVFSLIHKSNEIEFSKDHFTIAELEKGFFEI